MILRPLFGQIQLSIDQATKARFGGSDSDVVDAVFDLSAIAVILPFDSASLISTLGRSCLVNGANRF